MEEALVRLVPDSKARDRVLESIPRKALQEMYAASNESDESFKNAIKWRLERQQGYSAHLWPEII